MASAPQSVTFVTCEFPPFPGGIATYSGALVDVLRGRGHATDVIAPDYETPPDAAPDVPGTHRLLGHHKIVPTNLPKITKLLRSSPPDAILICADIRSAMLTYLLSPLHRRRYRIGIHGSEVSKLSGRSPLIYLARRAYHNADMIAANSKDTLDVFVEETGYRGRAVVAHLGTDPQWFEPASGPFEHPELAALSSNRLIFCCVGRVERRKGQVNAVKALAKARDAHGLAAPILVIAGHIEDPDYAAEVAEAAHEAGLDLIVTGRLSLDDIKRLYARAICNILLAENVPGRREGFGLVLVEAAALGCPSIASDVGGIPEALGETGAKVPAGDIEAAALAASRFAADDHYRAGAADAAREHARAFSWVACAAATFPELRLE